MAAVHDSASCFVSAMPSPPAKPVPGAPPPAKAATFFVRHVNGTETGPFDLAALAGMRSERKLTGVEFVSADRKSWQPLSALSLANPARMPPAIAPRPAAAVSPPMQSEDDFDGISLAPLDLDLGHDARASGASPSPAPSREPPTPASQTLALDADDADLSSLPILELEEPEPPRSAPKVATPSPKNAPATSARSPGAAKSPAPLSSPLSLSPLVSLSHAPTHTSPARPAGPSESYPALGGGDQPISFSMGLDVGDDAEIRSLGTDGIPGSSIGSDASAAVAALLEGETDQIPDSTARVLLSPAEPPPTARPRTRTLTAALPGSQSASRRLPWPPTRQQSLIAGGALVVIVLGSVAAFTDVIENLRGEPNVDSLMAEWMPALAQDQYPAFVASAERLEAAAAKRKRAPLSRARAAELLAEAVVLHGGDRSQVNRAKELIEAAVEQSPAGSSDRLARAQAWVALAQGRWREAETFAQATSLAEGDRAVLLGWAALGRGDAPKATARFGEAVKTSPAPAPSETATRFGLARAKESDLSPKANEAFRAVLSSSAGHVGAALGLARAATLSPSARSKLAKSTIESQARTSSRAELASAHLLLAAALREESMTSTGAASTAAKAESERALQKARVADPASPALAVFLGDGLLAEGRYDEAIARYRAALAVPLATPTTPNLRFARVAALIESGRSAEASPVLRELETRLPTDPRVPFWRARLAEHASPPEPDVAEKAYRDALARDARFLPAVLQLGRLLIEKNRSREALDVLKRADNTGTPATVRLSLGQAQLAAGNASAALATFRQIVATEPGNTSARMGLASALESANDWTGAVREWSALAAATNPAPQQGTSARLAAALVRVDRRGDALAIYERDIKAGTATPSTRVAAARLAIAANQKDRARSWATSAVDEDPRTPGALLVLAELARGDGNPSQAVADLRRALAVDGSPEVQLEFGRALAALGRDEEALAAFASASAIPAAGIERGRILLRRGDAEAATRELTTALAKQPNSADGLLYLGLAEDRLGHRDKAEIAWHAAARSATTGATAAEVHYRLGRLQMDRGQPAPALRDLRMAAEHPPGEGTWLPDLYFQLGFAEKRQGTTPRSQAAFRKYLDLAPPDAPARAEVTKELAN